MYYHEELKVAWCANARTGSRWQRDILFGERNDQDPERRELLPGRGFKKHAGHHSGPFMAPFLDRTWTIAQVVRDPYDVIISFYFSSPKAKEDDLIDMDWLVEHPWANTDMMYPNVWQAEVVTKRTWLYQYELGLVGEMELFIDSLKLPRMSTFEARHVLGKTKTPYRQHHHSYFTAQAWEYVQKKHEVERKILGYV
jgi:hypothetical protein